MSDIAELFARDPLKLTKAEIKDIVAFNRANRAQFNLGNIKAGKAVSKPKVSAKLAGLDLKIDLSNLGKKE